jgi:hypothetical protein
VGDDAQPWRTIVGLIPDLRLGEFAENELKEAILPSKASSVSSTSSGVPGCTA